MSTFQAGKKKSFDSILLFSYLALVVIGWFMLYSTVYKEDDPYAFLNISTIIGAQSAWIIISLIAFVVTLTLDWKFWNTFAFPIYAITVLLLILVLIFGSEINGSKSWFSFGAFSIQPAEWAKLGTVLGVSSYLSFSKSNIINTNALVTTLALFIGPALLIMLQPDAGSAMVFLSFFILLFRRGLSPFIFILFISLSSIFITSLVFSPLIVTIIILFAGVGIFSFNQLNNRNSIFLLLALSLISLFLYQQNELTLSVFPLGIAFIVFSIYLFINKNFKLTGLLVPIVTLCVFLAYFSEFVIEKGLKPHQQDRINVWLRPERCDPKGSLYNIIQSKLAIGSGGLVGKGYLKGEMTKLNYVPEQSTDFIFTSIGEEQGFIGSLGVIILFTILITRCIVIAEQAKLEFIKNFGYAVAGIIFFHFTINISMTLGLLPVVGIPLPFLSKGGSSLLSFSIMIAAVIKMDMARYRSNY